VANKIDAKEVELFLLDNLDFFESRESLVSELKFKHGESSASSLLERQVLKLRDEHSKLIDMLSGFVDTASENEDLFLKSKKLTLDLINCSNKKEVSSLIEDDLRNSFGVNECFLSFYENHEIEELEKNSSLSLHKGSIHCGSLSKEKIKLFFENKEIASVVIAVLIVNNQIGLLKIGSYDRAKYLGDEDTTFIEYIRDIVEAKLSSLS
jgi:uncharacterized protein YigA (DUF484 family)